MVFFNCDKCGEALKKNQVEKHHYRCYAYSYSCIDCQTVFDINTYAQHLKCISESEKYGGRDFQAKANKGELKQTAWTDQVEQAIAKVKSPDLRSLLQRISGFANIPRKEAKFINFLMNSIKIRDRNLCERAWAAIAEEAKAMQVATEAEKKVQLKETEVSASAACQDNEKKLNGSQEAEPTHQFKWKKAIKRKVKEIGEPIKIKKLKKVLKEDFVAAGGDISEFSVLFDEKISKAAVIIDAEGFVSLTA